MGEGPSIWDQLDKGGVRPDSRHARWVKEHEDRLAGKDPYVVKYGKEDLTVEQRKVGEVKRLFIDFMQVLENNEDTDRTNDWALYFNRSSARQ